MARRAPKHLCALRTVALLTCSLLAPLVHGAGRVDFRLEGAVGGHAFAAPRQRYGAGFLGAARVGWEFAPGVALQLSALRLHFPGATGVEGAAWAGAAGFRFLPYARADGRLASFWLDGNAALYTPVSARRLAVDAGLGVELWVLGPLLAGPFLRYEHLFPASRRGSGSVVAHTVFAGLTLGLATRSAPPPAAAPPSVEAVPAPTPLGTPGDADGDGVPDALDGCPQDAETRNGVDDEDGCPETDSDGDGTLDVLDRCPQEAEDVDGFQDQDGCPELDDDGDQIPDAQDACPRAAGVAHEAPKKHGCPGEPAVDVTRDQDNDGVPDAQDRCPNAPETYDGFHDDDGCPEATARVFIRDRRIVIKERVTFRTNGTRLQAGSRLILTELADLLERFPQIRKVRIEGHTDSKGGDEKNFLLSTKRAEAVRKFLIRRGVAARRLEAVGYGRTQPLVEGGGLRSREVNRRVEVLIVEPPTFDPRPGRMDEKPLSSP